MADSIIFPIIDISNLTGKYLEGHGYKEDIHSDPCVQEISKEIVNGFTKYGFIYIKGHNIDEDLIQETFKVSKEFFVLENDVKKTFQRNPDTYWGYVPFNVETFDKTRPFDLKECFNMYPYEEKRTALDSMCPDFRKRSEELYMMCMKVGFLLMKTINIALKTEDPNFLLNKHCKWDDKTKNPTTLRLLYYPSIDNKESINEKQLRCGEHSDYGTITLLFQDDTGGLQVVSPSGEYVDAVPIPGCIVVNAGDLLELWSGKRFKSTRHRVVIPTNTNKSRQSLAFFLYPDYDVNVFNLEVEREEGDKGVNALEYLVERYSKSY